jgi:hypothetical protein
LLSSICGIHIAVVDFGNLIAQNNLINSSIKKWQNIDSSEKDDLVFTSTSVELIVDFGLIFRSLLYSLRVQDSFMVVKTNYILPIKNIFSTVDFMFPSHLHDISPDFWRNFAEIEHGKHSILSPKPQWVN